MARTKQTSTKARIQEILQPASQKAYKTPTQSGRPQLATKGGRMSESIGCTPHKKIRHKNGALAMIEIKKYQKSVNLLIPRRPFHRLVREIAVNFKTDILFKAETMEILQEASEMYLTSMFEESYLICLHTGRVTLMEKDIKLLQRIRGVADAMPRFHVAISGSALLLTAATFERFLTIYKYRAQFSTQFRLVMSSVALFFALAAKGPMFFELDVVANENCTGVTAYRPEMKEWTYEEPYKTVYKFWFRSIVNTFFPFFLSFYFNIRIISRLNQQHAAARLFRFATSEHRKNIRSATNMLVMVTACYIACNSLNVIVTAWEFVDIDSLLTQEVRPFYTYSSDLVSLLTVFASAVRLPIYYACNARIRREVNAYFLRFCRCDKTSSEFSRDNASLATVRYLNSGNGYVIYKAQKERKNGLSEAKFVVGTGFDKIVLQVAMRGWNRKSNLRTSIQRSCTPKDFI